VIATSTNPKNIIPANQNPKKRIIGKIFQKRDFIHSKDFLITKGKNKKNDFIIFFIDFWIT